MTFCTENKLTSKEFMIQNRKYKYPDRSIRDPMENEPRYIPPEHTYKPTNDENTRMPFPKVDAVNFLKVFGVHYENFIKPQSSYFRVNHNNTVYHVFDAKRMPLGRLAIQAAKYLTGKHKPVFDPKKVLENGDRVIVVNGEDIKVTGKKRYHWIFYHHTQYAGALHKIVFKDLMKKDPEQLIKRVIRGMLPHNRSRKFILERIHVHRGQYHNHISQKLPQFIDQPLPDPNDLFPAFEPGTSNPDDWQVLHAPGDNLNPPELEGIERVYDPELYIPERHYRDQFKLDVRNKKIEGAYNNYKRKLKRFKEYK